MQISPILWLAAAVGFLALEASTFNMTSIWFAIGSAAALLCCVFTGSFRVQAVVFLVVSILCLAAFRPLAAKLRLKHTATNGDRNLGREAIVLSPVTAEVPGRVRLDGVGREGRRPPTVEADLNDLYEHESAIQNLYFQEDKVSSHFQNSQHPAPFRNPPEISFRRLLYMYSFPLPHVLHR